jgi:hypothetical protein
MGMRLVAMASESNRPTFEQFWPKEAATNGDHGRALLVDAQLKKLESDDGMKEAFVMKAFVGQKKNSKIRNVYPPTGSSMEELVHEYLSDKGLDWAIWFWQDANNKDHKDFPGVSASWLTEDGKEFRTLKGFGGGEKYSEQTNALCTTSALKAHVENRKSFYSELVEEVSSWRAVMSLSEPDLKGKNKEHISMFSKECDVAPLAYSLYVELKKGITADDTNNVWHGLTEDRFYDLVSSKQGMDQRGKSEFCVFLCRLFGKVYLESGMKQAQRLFRVVGYDVELPEKKENYIKNFVERWGNGQADDGDHGDDGEESMNGKEATAENEEKGTSIDNDMDCEETVLCFGMHL